MNSTPPWSRTRCTQPDKPHLLPDMGCVQVGAGMAAIGVHRRSPSEGFQSFAPIHRAGPRQVKPAPDSFCFCQISPPEAPAAGRRSLRRGYLGTEKAAGISPRSELPTQSRTLRQVCRHQHLLRAPPDLGAQHPRQQARRTRAASASPAPGRRTRVVIVPSQTSPRSFRKITSSSPAGKRRPRRVIGLALRRFHPQPGIARRPAAPRPARPATAACAAGSAPASATIRPPQSSVRRSRAGSVRRAALQATRAAQSQPSPSAADRASRARCSGQRGTAARRPTASSRSASAPAARPPSRSALSTAPPPIRPAAVEPCTTPPPTFITIWPSAAPTACGSPR